MITFMKTTAIGLAALLLAALLTACAGGGGMGTTSAAPGTASGTAPAASGTTPGTAPAAPGTTSAAPGTTHATSPAASGTTSGTTTAASPKDVQIRYNNALYKGTEEELRADELGRELMEVTVVEGTPSANGEARGAAEGSRLYAIKDVNDYSAIAFQCGGVYYRAEKSGS